MRKSEWYKVLFARADKALLEKYYFEVAFICYGIIDDRLNSLMKIHNIPIGKKGVAEKVRLLAKEKSTASEEILKFSNWDQKKNKYKNHGKLKAPEKWGKRYRNPMQHTLGDPRDYRQETGKLHSDMTIDMASEGIKVARDLSSTVMKYKKYRKKNP